MSAFVFTGPTLSALSARRELDAVYLPPAAAGDLYRAALQKPKVIGLIDGYFDSTPSVRHKEILWAMHQGIHVLGCASIGALRAAELAPFGMEGVGAIFELYRNGQLEDDDEVAIAHGPPQSGYVSFSEAMVNIRQTLASAADADIISPATAKALAVIGKALFYPDRSYAKILRLAFEQGLAEGELQAFKNWLPQGQLNQKRIDAILMLQTIRQRLSDGINQKIVTFSFAHTAMWESTYRRRGKLSGPVAFESLLDELRFSDLSYEHECLLALERFFAREEAARQGVTAARQHPAEARASFCRAYNLTGPEALATWSHLNDLDGTRLDALAKEDAQIRWVHSRARFLSENFLPDHLRLTGQYARLRARAEAKQAFLEARGLQEPRLEDAALSEERLLEWYRTEVRRKPGPQEAAAESWEQLGFSDRNAFRRSLLKEYLFRGGQQPGCSTSAP